MGTKRGRSVLAAIVLGTALATAACSPLYRNHGFVPSPEELQALQPGVDTRETITTTIGQPTTSGVLGEGAFYYVESRFRRVGPFEPEEIERQIVAMDFDPSGVLRNIERYGLEDGRAVVLTRRITDDGLRDTTFLRQLLGNIGNVSAEQLFGGDE
ncbi:outer membrane protein assembly factor BamE [Histidinibacterium aquaticum]|uniref:Outer membrane protein assembly factor BamE n=1 Tax=Histidinibacterium aquaticum TaxID=2613962 RepID=A0A5J5GCJ3_9RHOB|nr:outer membrane protein assembly factor BamE [Histidinibacterium aquaticum]KAA9005678.1 outer membrane protein assembly factor BamE [Histidinibacterium aquaticum]